MFLYLIMPSSHPQWATLPPASHVHSLVMKWGFHMRAKHFSGGGARVLPRRTTGVRPQGTSVGSLQGHLPLTTSITHFWSCIEYFTKDKHPEHYTSTIKPFSQPASEMSDENFISQRNVYWSNARVILLLPKWEALLCMYLFAFNHSVIPRWMV